MVPPAAVQNGPDGQYVLVVKADQTVELRRQGGRAKASHVHRRGLRRGSAT